jgi:hypothetical protein
VPADCFTAQAARYTSSKRGSSLRFPEGVDGLEIRGTLAVNAALPQVQDRRKHAPRCDEAGCLRDRAGPSVFDPELAGHDVEGVRREGRMQSVRHDATNFRVMLA